MKAMTYGLIIYRSIQCVLMSMSTWHRCADSMKCKTYLIMMVSICGAHLPRCPHPNLFISWLASSTSIVVTITMSNPRSLWDPSEQANRIRVIWHGLISWLHYLESLWALLSVANSLFRAVRSFILLQPRLLACRHRYGLTLLLTTGTMLRLTVLHTDAPCGELEWSEYIDLPLKLTYNKRVAL